MGHNRDDDPMSPIRLLERFRVSFDRLRRFAKGDSKDEAPLSPIKLSREKKLSLIFLIQVQEK